MLNVSLPRPLQIVIDDVGWWSGADDSKNNGPYRTGMPRDHCVADYEAIVSLGKQLGMKPQAGFVACEWDKENILREVPTSQWMGTSWDNSRWSVGHAAAQQEAAKILRENRGKHLELMLHAVGHEYWLDGKMTRANWAGKQGVMWPAEDMRRHLRAYLQILNQHDLGPMPECFVPAAGGFSFGKDERGFSALLREVGVRHNSTPYAWMPCERPTEHPQFGLDAGVLTLDRGEDPVNWNVIDAHPTAEVIGPICGMHWTNILHPDPARNEEVVSRWVELLKPYDDRFDRMLSRSTAECWTQFVYSEWTHCTATGPTLALDFAKIDALPGLPIEDTFYLKIATDPACRFIADGLAVDAVWDEKQKYFRIKASRRGNVQRAMVWVVK